MEALDDFWWADRFGWTPNQVDAMNTHRVYLLKQATAAIDEGRRQAEKEQAERSKSR